MVALGEGTRDIRCRGSYAMVANMKWVWEWSCCCFHVVMLACQAPKRARLAASPNINTESPLTNRRGCRPSNAKEIKTSMPAGQKCMNDDRKRVVGRTALLSMGRCRLEESSSQCQTSGKRRPQFSPRRRAAGQSFAIGSARLVRHCRTRPIFHGSPWCGCGWGKSDAQCILLAFLSSTLFSRGNSP